MKGNHSVCLVLHAIRVCVCACVRAGVQACWRVYVRARVRVLGVCIYKYYPKL